MQLSQLPTLLKLAFAALGGKNSIPVASQLPGNINGASYTDGFPPATRTAIVAGGKPPAGLDVNGVLFDISSHIRWLNAGGPYAYDSSFATDSNVGGYPQGAQITSADLQGAWLSLNDNNTDNPDTGAGTKWVPARAYGVTAVTGLTNANVTLTPAQAAKNKITLAGTLTGNVQIIFPAWLKDWSVTNNTTGAFTLTCKTAAGTGIAIPQDGSPTKIVGDGTNITQPPENVAAATQSQHAMQLGQATGRVLRVTTMSNTGTFTPGAGTNAVLVRLVGGGGAGGGAPATGASQVSVGSGGASGAYSEGYFTSGFSGVTVTIGAGGTPASGTTGGNGGASSFGALLTAPGGPGGVVGGPATPPFQPVAPNPAAAGIGGYLNSPGTVPPLAFAAATGCFIGGPGANSPLGAGGAQISTNSNGNAGAVGGGGGGGTQQQASSGALSGGAGGKGLCIIVELA